MILHDRELHRIAANGAIDPYDPEMVQPSSVDLRLGTTFRVAKAHKVTTIDLADVPPPDDISELVEIQICEQFVIHPGEFVLGSTFERFVIPPDVAMCLDGKSSLGRLGLIIHVTAGYFDPGFRGVGTLEMVNLSPVPIILRPGLKICQSRWMRMESKPENLYRGRYQNDMAATGSRYGQD